MTLGEQLVRLRTAQGLTQDDLAEAVGVSRQSVSKWENDASVPDLDRLVKLSTLFGVSLDELVRGTPTPEPESPGEPAAPASEGAGLRLHRQRCAGIALLAVGLLTTVLFLLLAPWLLPLALLLCAAGVECLMVRRHVGLVLGWTVCLYGCGLVQIFSQGQGIAALMSLHIGRLVSGGFWAVLTLVALLTLRALWRWRREKAAGSQE